MDQELLKKYITGDASPDEKEEIVRWVNVDKKNMTELFALHKLHNITIWQQKQERTENKKRRYSKWTIIQRIASIAAIFVILLGSGFYILHLKQQIPDTTMQTMYVPAGQRAELILSDGTSVWLNAGSTFSFPTIFSKNSREVKLDGEGYFNVKKDEQRTFVVKTSSYDVKVLGTEFNVFAYGKSPLFEVSLIKGAVEIMAKDTNEKIKLEPNTMVYLFAEKLNKKIINNFDNILWKDGLISFDDEPIEKMIDKLELYYDVHIIIQNASVAKQKYTGKFRTKDGIEHMLKVFQLKDKFTYEKNDETNTIVIK